MDAILTACAAHGVAVEINANPWRLDLDWRWCERAVQLGCLLSINPDAHSTNEIDKMGRPHGAKGRCAQGSGAQYAQQDTVRSVLERAKATRVPLGRAPKMSRHLHRLAFPTVGITSPIRAALARRSNRTEILTQRSCCQIDARCACSRRTELRSTFGSADCAVVGRPARLVSSTADRK
jgi:hypothetical protein